MRAPITLSLHLPNFNHPGTPPEALFEKLVAIAGTAEESGFSSLTVMDHLHQIPGVGPRTNAMLEGNVILAALAPQTSRVSLGLLVAGFVATTNAGRAALAAEACRPGRRELAAAPVAAAVLVVAAVAVAVGVGVGVATPLGFALLARSADPATLGRTMGTAELGRELGDAGAPALAGAVAAPLGLSAGLGALALAVAAAAVVPALGRRPAPAPLPD
jgi:hypothetical protein